MAKTYNTLSTVSAGSVLTATAYNEAVENSNNYRVPPMCKAIRSGNLSYTSATAVAWNDEAFDTDGMHDNSTNNSRITINTAGIYLFVLNVHITFTGTYTPGPDLQIIHSADGAIGYWYGGSSVAGAGVFNLSAVAECAASDYVEAKLTTTGASGVTVIASAASYLSAVWIGQVS